MPLLVIVAALLLLPGLAHALTFDVQPGELFCMYETVESDSAAGTIEFSASYMIHKASAREAVIFAIKDPVNEVVFESRQKLSDGFVFRADQEGAYQFCFFHRGAELGVEEAARVSLKVVRDRGFRQRAGQASALEGSVRRITEDISALQTDVQSQKLRGKRLEFLTGSTARRITAWFFAKAALLAAAAAWQVVFVKRYFGAVELRE